MIERVAGREKERERGGEVLAYFKSLPRLLSTLAGASNRTQRSDDDGNRLNLGTIKEKTQRKREREGEREREREKERERDRRYSVLLIRFFTKH